ncbi:DUF924 family protein [Neomegalonema sp.]|uniref:DUF924 family protein n=1 Tax=Neomegalonema sp. TaxID=2039713 RepID=UPI00262567AC|nr:DUF924 family protein [Neomegalonema sp.]MDD2868085.1 DUF924 family protein [Neomegalonema sp.]
MPHRSDVPLSEAAALVAFWRAAGREKWFTKDEAFDAEFRTRFWDSHMAAAARRCDGWMRTTEGALALLLLLDQYPRNSFRGTAHMYATDPLGVAFARQALEAGLDRQAEPGLRPFFYMPFMHSEALADQELCVQLFEALGDASLPHALEHRDVVARFGRFPHRNAMFGRETSAQEAAFLAEGGFAG